MRDAGLESVMLLGAGLACVYAISAASLIGPAPGYAAFLLSIAGSQAVSVVLAHRNRRPALALTAIVNVLLIAIWVLARSVGLPIGPAGAQPIGLLDSLCTLDSMLLVALTLGLLIGRGNWPCPPVGSRPAVAAVRWSAIVLAVGSLAALSHSHGSAASTQTLVRAAARYHFYCQLI